MSGKRNYSVFISFASKDEEQAYELCQGIEAHGLQCFFAVRDIQPGANFANEIVAAIMKSSIFVLIVSEASVCSSHVSREVNLAIEEGCRIIPLSFGQRPKKLPAEWRYWLSAVQMVRLESSEESAIVVVSALKDFEAMSETAVPIRNPVLDRFGRVEKREANIDSVLGNENFQSGSSGSPSALLRADAAAIQFIGREEELIRLNAWLTLSSRFLTRLIVGPGGVGKTRLARELCLQAERTGWRTAFVGPDVAIEENIHGGSTSALFVLDYAETRPSDVVKLITLLRTSSIARARVLLLARSAGDWWTSLMLKSPELESILTSSLPMKLGALDDTPGIADQVYKAALGAFSNSLGTPEPQLAKHRQFAVDSSPLELQTIALLDVLDVSGVTDTVVSQPPSERLLNHERRYFKNAVLADGIEGMDTVDLDRVLAIMTLLGAASEAEALENIERLGLPFKSTSNKKLVRLLRRLYSGPGSYFSGLRPDIIAEELVSQVVAGSGHHSEAVGFPVDMVPGATSSQLERALTVLGNAARHDHVRDALVTILAGLSDGVAEAAIRVATRLRSPERLVDAFKIGLTSKKHSRARLLSLLKEIPDETVALADVAADLCKVLVQMDDFEADGIPNSIETARFLIDASNRFSDVGRLNDAIETIRKGIEIQKGLQQNDSVRLELGAMLSNLSNRLWDAGHVDSALEPAKESVALFKGIGGEVVKELRYRKFYAAATSNLAFRLADVGQFESGLISAREAVANFNSLNEIRERFIESGAVSAMNNLVCLLNATADFCDAIDVANECMGRRRRQVSQDRDRFLPFFARALNNTAISYLGCGDREEALEFGHEGFELLLILSENRPLFTRDLSISGLNLAAIHASRGSDELAVDTIEIVLKRAFQGTQLTPPDNRIKVALEALKDALIGVSLHNRTVLRPINGSSRVPSADIPFALALEYKDL
jgi:tetratricopeptide (TPR) repeat protein